MRRWQALGLDLVSVLLFVIIGRGAHAEDAWLPGTIATAAPFLIGLAAGWVAISVTGLVFDRVWPAGVIVWLSTLGLGMILRAAFGAGIAVPFVLVAGTFLALTLLGWRALARAVSVRRGRGVHQAATPRTDISNHP